MAGCDRWNRREHLQVFKPDVLGLRQPLLQIPEETGPVRPGCREPLQRGNPSVGFSQAREVDPIASLKAAEAREV